MPRRSGAQPRWSSEGLERWIVSTASTGSIGSFAAPAIRFRARPWRRSWECSRATVNRAIEDLRDFLWAPLRYDRQRNGYYYDEKDGERPYELPGLWFNASELYALLAAQKLLARVGPGLLDGVLAPLRRRIEHILANERLSKGDVAQRVRILSMASRVMPPDSFTSVAGALMQRQRLAIVYHGRERDAVTERTVSPPQRLRALPGQLVPGCVVPLPARVAQLLP